LIQVTQIDAFSQLFFHICSNLQKIIDYVLIRIAFSCSGRFVLFLFSKFKQLNSGMYLNRILGLYILLHYTIGFHSGGQFPWCITQHSSSGVPKIIWRSWLGTLHSVLYLNVITLSSTSPTPSDMSSIQGWRSLSTQGFDTFMFCAKSVQFRFLLLAPKHNSHVVSL